MQMTLGSLSAAALVFALMAVTSPALAKEHENPGNGNGNGGGRDVRGAPAPLIGGAASLPVLAVGYGVYWLVKRRRKPNV
jgi:hypothetical protein